MRGEEGRTAWTPGTVSLLAALAIFVGALSSGRTWDLLPSVERMTLVLGAVVALAVVGTPRLRPIAPWFVTILVLGGGLLMRWSSYVQGGGSDVLGVTTEAIAVFLGGGNPYDHFYISSSPPGAPFPYPPVNLLIHLPGYLWSGQTGVRLVETVLAWVLMVVLAAAALRDRHPFALPLLALYAGLANLVNVVGDNSNDTSAGALAALFLVVLAAAEHRSRRWIIAAGVLAAVAIGTKQTALPLVVAASAWLLRADRGRFRPYLAAMLATLLVVSIPFLVQSGPVGYLKALTSFAGFHEDVYGWNIWTLAQGMGWPVATREEALVLGVAVGIVALVVIAVLPYRDLRTAMIAGAVAMAVVFFAQRWTAYSYFAQLISVMVVLPLVGRWDWPAPDADAADASPDGGAGAPGALRDARAGAPGAPPPSSAT